MDDAGLNDTATPNCDEFFRDVLAGLSQQPKTLPCKYFYNETGSQFFERICQLDEYYLTRTEIGIMHTHAADMARKLGSGCVLVEYGSGSSVKTDILLEQMESPAAFVPVDISNTILQQAAQTLSQKHSRLEVRPVCADFTLPFSLPHIEATFERTAVYFPGSTIGNFGPVDATRLLSDMRQFVGSGGGLLIGVDLPKDREVLELAYNDREGVTAKFNLNLLERINAELQADFQIENFRHRAYYNETKERVEMHLVSETNQTVHIRGTEFTFQTGESIHTENSHKYRLSRFNEIAQSAGWNVAQVWTDSEQFFSVQYLTAR